MQHSEKIDQIAAALVKAQANIADAKKDGAGNYGRYVTLASVVDACKPHLNAEGISFVQTFEPSDPDRMTLTTTLIHLSGQFISGTCTMKLPRADPQGYGSAATYARRYGLAAMVGVAPDDDDGAAGSGRTQGERGSNQQRSQFQGEDRKWRGRSDPQRAPQQKPLPPADKADRLADDGEFLMAVDDAFLAGKFPPSATDKILAKVLHAKGKTRLIELDLGDRHAFIGAITDGKFDSYKPAPQPAGA